MIKTEKDKMLAGEIYNATDTELAKGRQYARDLSYELNMTKPSDTEKRETIIDKLLIIKKPYHIESNFNCDYGYNIEIGKNFFANFNCTILDVCKVVIGDNVLFGPHVQVYTAMHPTDPTERLEGIEFAKPIKIGNNVWIGGGAVIFPGVTIGNNVTIGSGSVVTKDIPENTVAVGNPCKVIRSV